MNELLASGYAGPLVALLTGAAVIVTYLLGRLAWQQWRKSDRHKQA
jgi:hypothetical protein